VIFHDEWRVIESFLASTNADESLHGDGASRVHVRQTCVQDQFDALVDQFFGMSVSGGHDRAGMQFLQTLKHRVTVAVRFTAASLDFGGYLGASCA
jgi:hypothetical protein